MKMHDPEAVVRNVYECFDRDDIPAMLTLLADDVDWLAPGSASVPWAGRWRGREQVGACMDAIRSSADLELFETTEFLPSGNRVVVVGRERMRAKSTGRTCAPEWCQVWTVEDGKVTTFREYTDTAELSGAF